MTDKFNRPLKVGDYIVKLTSSQFYDNDSLLRIFGFDEEKEYVYCVEWTGIWKSEKKLNEDWPEACADPKEYYKYNKGMYGAAKRLNPNVVVKTYPPVWQKYDDMEKRK